MSQADNIPVLKASVHDVRYLSALLRGVNFANRATVTVTEKGLVIVVEESRTLLGTAYIFSDVFDEFIYHAEAEAPEAQGSQRQQQTVNEELLSAFEIPLNIFLELMNIFGTAGGSATSKPGRFKAWRKPGDESEEHESDGGEGDGTQEEGSSNKKAKTGQFFGGGSERKTGMRLTYIGPGYPLTLIVAEDASGLTTTCEIATFDAEPHLELPFDSDQMMLKIILKSSWLRDALSELDPSCDKLTFIGNPSDVPDAGAHTARQRQRARLQAQPNFRIEATGTFGNTEMDYPNDRDVLESFECEASVRFSYRFSHIARTMRALQTSVKTSLRIDNEGLLSLQFLMPSSAPRMNPVGVTSNFIEFRCLALEEDP
ncbi:Rad1/Rec1/Rad17 [Lentinula edodes]|uniref:Rad1/Rec1/Rad17 n=1 Tax=Lentinula edodes TaxID=5353 RepID=UPI001E8D0EEF|nr:Rad1/Rec1/Rad17 [Lentinula edodes]KAH7869594.1 Rad1/Rec1/Rad17 [Lentinula edodes]KAJ3907193.1 Rad1/Rec1/Rad17 [Lentinula edodes]